MRGNVYLIHFTRPLKHARHYIGFALNVEKRMAEHRKGQGARLLAVLAEQGIPWVVAQVWEGKTRRFERRLKKRDWGPISDWCPICQRPPDDSPSRRPYRGN